MSGVLVLNASYEPLHRVSLQHAIGMLVREVAVVEEAGIGSMGPYPVPKVLRLVRYVVMRWKYRARRGCTKEAIRARDVPARTAVDRRKRSITSFRDRGAVRSRG